MSDTISEGDHVVLMKNFDSQNVKIISVKSGTIIHYGKLHFDPSPVVGSTFGSVFEIGDGTMKKVDNFDSFNNDLSQEMSNKMGSNFVEKTQFSQEKIIKKKKKQSHSNIVTVTRPTLLLLNDMLYARNKICGLRSDLVAQILTSANVQNGAKVLLLDHNLGMLTSAVMSRILPEGNCVQILPDHEAYQTTRKTMRLLNIKDSDCLDKLFSITIRDFYKFHTKVDEFVAEDEILATRGGEHLKRLKQQEMTDHHFKRGEASGEKVPVDNLDEESREQLIQTLIKKEANRESRQRERLGATSCLRQASLDSLIFVIQSEHPFPLFEMLYSYLLPSRQFVIYSDVLEPLLECHQYLKTNCLAISLSLSESWLRKHQVLPDRTRPEMSQSGYGGYLLSGIKALYGQTGPLDGDKTSSHVISRTEI